MIATTATDPPAAATGPKLVVDTSAWIEWFVDSDIGRLVDAALSQPERCIVPTIVQMELAKWALRELPEDQHLRLVRLTQKCHVDALDSGTAFMAASANVEHKLALADAIIYATAQKFGAEVVTCDAHFKGLPAVRFYPKLARASENSIPAFSPWERWPTSDQFDHPQLTWPRQ
ncbi:MULTISPECIES: type II toxin-antitoxin system VapC family toxin [unclassified Roseateles]|uniref:type II toxin-antitoxin system VapC family toxin n=1 Tax=unclassified Roseateles TaxID=2626991 RepID=UPI0018250DD9|nr:MULTISPECIES: type II toxin-antitoxin system VapC family toxin [unclassified Roseateles]MBB3282256.1 putative nucleic acid-binding protein [Mitsuaria sp. BK037]MBB3294310.1 putative nucleic acid-binding protein [Mitsuaria sp. BK041]MBB3363526.1 putative nucleic acid-binding protein [Mitsuaria sp. BK045]